jgi:hypothetical protein
MHKIKTVVIVATMVILAVATTVLAFIASANQSDAKTTVNPAGEVFIIGPGSKETFFFIKDESRPPTVLWTCGFIHNFTPNRFGGDTPEISCNH